MRDQTPQLFLQLRHKPDQLRPRILFKKSKHQFRLSNRLAR
jgi:hypothetical protein